MNQALTLTPDNTTPELPELLEEERRALRRALIFLVSQGAKFRIIFPNGASFGDLETMPVRKRTQRVKRGEWMRHFLPHVKDIKPGTGGAVPTDDMEPRGLARAVSAWCVSTWGKGNFSTRLDLENKRVVVFREE